MKSFLWCKTGEIFSKKFTMENYQASNRTVFNTLQSVRDNYDIFELSNQINERGDFKKISNKLKINRSVLSRVVEEASIISEYPSISKQRSKVNPLSTLKTEKEKKLFFENYNIENTAVRDLYKLIKEWRIKLEKNPKLLLNDEQHDLIVGSLLGDSSVRMRNKNCSFRVSHSKKQKDYLEFKRNLLKGFSTNNDLYFRKKKLGNHILETFEFSTFTHSVFNFYRKLFYPNGEKKITREVLDMLNPRGLAFWICDDGSYDNRQGYIVLCTNSFSLDEHKIMKKYFEEKWNLSPTIGFKDKKYYYLRFKQNDSKKLIEIIKPFIIDSMKYKIGEKNE